MGKPRREALAVRHHAHIQIARVTNGAQWRMKSFFFFFFFPVIVTVGNCLTAASQHLLQLLVVTKFLN